MTVWEKLSRIRLRGNWRPGRYNAVLLIAQVIILWTAAQRGMDYLTMPDRLVRGAAEMPMPLRGIEADIPLEVLGLAFLVPAGVGFVSLAMGWAKPLSLGHLFIGASYLVLGITFLRDSPLENGPMAFGGCALLMVAAALMVADSRQVPDLVAVVGGVAAMVVGGWLAAKGLGNGYRTGNGFLGGAALHFVMGFGTQLMARRDERLRREEEEDFLELRQAG